MSWMHLRWTGSLGNLEITYLSTFNLACAQADADWCAGWSIESICKGFGGEYAQYCPKKCCSVLK